MTEKASKSSAVSEQNSSNGSDMKKPSSLVVFALAGDVISFNLKGELGKNVGNDLQKLHQIIGKTQAEAILIECKELSQQDLILQKNISIHKKAYHIKIAALVSAENNVIHFVANIEDAEESDNFDAFKDVFEISGTEMTSALIHQFSIPYALLELSFDKKGNPTDYTYRAANAAYEELSGLKSDVLIGKSCNEIYKKVDLNWITFLHEVSQQKEATKLFHYDTDLNKYLEISVLSPSKNLVACAYYDITEFITSNKELEAHRKTIVSKNKFLEEVMRGVANPLWVVEKRDNVGFVYTESNEAHSILTGIKLEGKSEVEVDQLLEKYSKEYVDAVLERYKDCVETKKRIQYEEFIQVDGVDMWNLTTLSPQIDSKGKVYRIVCSATDITHIKKAEEEIIKAKEKAMEADRLKTVFLANLSHEIRTPLNSIIGFSELIQDGDIEDDEREDMCRIIERNSTQLMKLITDIIEISKVESEQLKVVYRDFDINRLMDDLSHELEIEMYRKKKALPVKVSKELYDRVIFSSDEYRIKQIFEHLLNNALKFCEKGPIEFGYTRTDDNESVLFYVKDKGIGIEKDKQDAIFDLFRQIDDNSTRRYAGTGLGLSLCKRITNILGGKMWVESELGKGSTFFFSIPKRA